MKRFILIKCKNNIPFSLSLFKTKFRALSQMRSDFYKEINSHNIDSGDKMHCGIDTNDGSAWITIPKDTRGYSRDYDWKIITLNRKNLNKNYALVKSFERNISIVGFFSSNNEAKIAMAKDFENEIIYSAQESVRIIEDRLQSSYLKPEPISHQEHAVIDLDGGCASSSSDVGYYNWQIIGLKS